MNSRKRSAAIISLVVVVAIPFALLWKELRSLRTENQRLLGLVGTASLGLPQDTKKRIDGHSLIGPRAVSHVDVFPEGVEIVEMDPDQIEEMEARFKEDLAKTHEAWVQAEAKTFTERLGLSSEQREQLEELLRAEGALGDEKFAMTLASSSHKYSDEFKEALSKILTEEQQREFEAMDQELNANRLEGEAYMALGKLQSSMSLTNAQKDAAFEAFKGLAEKYTSPPQPGEGLGDYLEEKQNETLAAMEPILTPEQLEVFKSQAQGHVMSEVQVFDEIPAGFEGGSVSNDIFPGTPETVPEPN